MLENRDYMRPPQFRSSGSATMMLLVANAVVFLLECAFYGYPVRLPIGPRPDWFALSVEGLRHGYVWQLLTFQFMHVGLMHLLCNSLAIFFFGRELEDTLGRKAFLTLYFTSGVVGGLMQTGAGFLFPLRFGGATLGASAGALGLVAAFATLYPERPLTMLVFFILPLNMRAKFLLLLSVLLAVFGLIFPADHLADAAHLGGIVAGVLFIRYGLRGAWRWPNWRLGRSRKPVRLVKVPAEKGRVWTNDQPPPAEELPAEDFVTKEVDPILDKISAHGIQSLTERERRILEAARARMAKK